MKKTLIIGIVLLGVLMVGSLIWLGQKNTQDASAGAATRASDSEIVLTSATNKVFGNYLITPQGMTLYTYTNDEETKSNCTGACATQWLPYLVSITNPKAASNIQGKLGTIPNGPDSFQLTYNGKPLYLSPRDQKAGDTLGNSTGGVWFVAHPK